MLAKLFDMTLGTIPPEARTPLWRVLLTLAVLTFMAGAGGHLPWFSGYAVQSEMELRHMRFEEHVERVELTQNRLLRTIFSQEVCRLFRLRNESPIGSSLRGQLQQSLFEKQEQYRAVADNERYAVSECAL